jgi:broad specificity phosphatase PhoE
MKLILVRHGETTGNSAERYWGATDLPLGKKGLEQARRLRQRLAGEILRSAFCSELKRAVQTTEGITYGRSLSAARCAELNEVNFGKLEGLTAEEIMSSYPDFYTQWVRWDTEIAFPGGESMPGFKTRVARFSDRLEGQRDAGAVLVVAHAGSLRMLICHLLGLPLPYWRKIKLDLASVSTMELGPTGVVLTCLNDTSHLA